MKKSLFMVLILIILLSSMPAFADMSFTAYYPDTDSDFSVLLDGQYWLDGDEYGAEIYPFFIEGSLYLPVDVMAYLMGVTAHMDYEYNSLLLYNNDPYIPEDYIPADNMPSGEIDGYVNYTDEEFQSDFDTYLIEFEKELNVVLSDPSLNAKIDSELIELRTVLEDAGLVERTGGKNFTNTTDAELAEIIDGTKPAFEFLVESVKIIWQEYKVWIIIIAVLYVSYKVFMFIDDFKKNSAAAILALENEEKVKTYEYEIEKLNKELEWYKSN